MRRGIAIALLGTAWLASGCGGATINQDTRSGEDKHPDGADEVQIGEDGEGASKDSVSYPTGDRVDWKVFQIKTPKDIVVSLKWKPSREGLDLAFNVLDEGFNVQARARPAEGSGKTRKEVELKAAPAGKYYVQIYAPDLVDGGEYTLEVSVRDVRTVDVGSVPKLPDPPRLASLPQICPPGTPPEKCPQGAATLQACPPGAQAGAQCSCPPGNTPPPCPLPCPPNAPAGTPCLCSDGVSQPPCPAPPVVLLPSITEVTVAGQGLNVTLNRGTKDKVAKGCMGVVYRGPKGTKELPNSSFAITDVTERESRGNIPKMTLDELGPNRRTKLVCEQKIP